jgi:hypothetical protein
MAARPGLGAGAVAAARVAVAALALARAAVAALAAIMTWNLAATPLGTVAAAAAATPAPPTAATLLHDADRARGGILTGITWNATVEADDEGTRTTRSFLVKARGNDALVECLAPPRSKGELMLFNDRVLWFTKPGLRRPVSISARQRLSGDAANGDISSTNYARDYEGTIVGRDTLAGEPAYRLELKARARNVMYDGIRYWVSASRHLALRAEFLTVNGKVFKTADFEHGNTLRSSTGDLPFVSRMTIRDATGTGRVTQILFDRPRAEVHPLTLFNINNVMR